MPTSNFQPIRLLELDCSKFTYLMTNSADPDQLASSEASWSGSTVCNGMVYLGSAGRVKEHQGPRQVGCLAESVLTFQQNICLGIP